MMDPPWGSRDGRDRGWHALGEHLTRYHHEEDERDCRVHTEPAEQRDHHPELAEDRHGDEEARAAREEERCGQQPHEVVRPGDGTRHRASRPR